MGRREVRPLSGAADADLRPPAPARHNNAGRRGREQRHGDPPDDQAGPATAGVGDGGRWSGCGAACGRSYVHGGICVAAWRQLCSSTYPGAPLAFGHVSCFAVPSVASMDDTREAAMGPHPRRGAHTGARAPRRAPVPRASDPTHRGARDRRAAALAAVRRGIFGAGNRGPISGSSGTAGLTSREIRNSSDVWCEDFFASRNPMFTSSARAGSQTVGGHEHFIAHERSATRIPRRRTGTVAWTAVLVSSPLRERSEGCSRRQRDGGRHGVAERSARSPTDLDRRQA